MFCKVRVPLSARTGTLVVPAAAVQSDGSRSRVFVIRDGRAYERTVQTGLSTDQSTEILDGVSPNDTVATVGINNLKDSAAVTIVE